MLPFEFLMRSGYIFVVIAFPNCVTLLLVFNFTLTGFLNYCPARGLGSNHPRARLGAEASSCRTAQREASGTEHHSPIIPSFPTPHFPKFSSASLFSLSRLHRCPWHCITSRPRPDAYPIIGRSADLRAGHGPEVRFGLAALVVPSGVRIFPGGVA